jgi:hypothetical protein
MRTRIWMDTVYGFGCRCRCVLARAVGGEGGDEECARGYAYVAYSLYVGSVVRTVFLSSLRFLFLSPSTLMFSTPHAPASTRTPPLPLYSIHPMC